MNYTSNSHYNTSSTTLQLPTLKSKSRSSVKSLCSLHWLTRARYLNCSVPFASGIFWAQWNWSTVNGDNDIYYQRDVRGVAKTVISQKWWQISILNCCFIWEIFWPATEQVSFAAKATSQKPGKCCVMWLSRQETKSKVVISKQARHTSS